MPRRGALQARDELRASTQRNCMQARSADRGRMRGRGRMQGRGHRPRGCIIYTWRGREQGGEGEGEGQCTGEELCKHATNCVQARSGTACKHAANASGEAEACRSHARGEQRRRQELRTEHSTKRELRCGLWIDRRYRRPRNFSETRFCRHSLHPLLVFLLSRRVHDNCQSTSANSGPQEGGPCGAYVVRRPVFAPVKIRDCLPTQITSN